MSSMSANQRIAQLEEKFGAYLRDYKFTVIIGNSLVSVSKIHGLSTAIDKHLTLVKFVDHELIFTRWMNSRQPCDISIAVDGGLQFKVIDATPVQLHWSDLDVGSDGLLMESLVITYDRLEVMP